jgi:hypothetical protein
MPFAYTVFDSFYTLRAGSLGPVGRGLYDASFNFGSTLGGHAVRPPLLWKAVTSKAEPTQQQDSFLICL